MSYWLHIGFRHVTIERGEDSLGHVRMHERRTFWDEAETTSRNMQNEMSGALMTQIRREILVLLSGPAAAQIRHGKDYAPGGGGDGSDRAVALDLAICVCGEEREALNYREWLCTRAQNVLSYSPLWYAVQRLAERLLECRTLKSRDARKVIQDALRDSLVTQKAP